MSSETISEKTATSGREEVLLKGLEILGDSAAVGMSEEELLSELQTLRVSGSDFQLKDIIRDIRDTEKILSRHKYKPNALIQILLDIQGKMRWLPPYVLKWISRRLQLALTQIYQIADFYEAFSLEPQGAHLVQLCMGTACHVRGANELLSKVASILGIEPGQTDSKRIFTLKTVNCLGCCALAPVIKVDDQYYSNPTLNSMTKMFKSFEESGVQS